MERSGSAWDAIVCGSGLAGLSCAFDLASAGKRVLVLEARAVLGGRTSSWIEDGMPVESGLHRFLGFYRALPDLLRRAGLDPDRILFWEDAVEIRTPDGGPRGVFGLSPLHHPLATAAGLVGNNRLLPPLDKLRLLRFAAAGLRDYVLHPDRLDRLTVEEYANRHGVNPRLVHRLLVPLTAGLFFLPVDRYSAFAFFGLLAPAVAKAPSLRVGAFRGGMTEVMAAPLAGAIERKGGAFRTGTAVDRIVLGQGGVEGVEAAGEILRANRVVLALSLGPAQDVLRRTFGEAGAFASLLRLPTMPAFTVQMELQSRALPFDRTTFGPGTCWASFSEQSRTTFTHAPGRLSLILSPPERFLGMERDEVLAEVKKDGVRLGIPLEGRFRRARILPLARDFHSLAPGSEALRPGQETSVPGLVLAGDYTRQPMLATMEGAVLSGREAARIVLRGGAGR